MKPPRKTRKTRLCRAVMPMAGLAAFLMPLSLSAQETGQIAGVVVAEATQQPLSGVQVFIQGTEFGTLTQQDGRFLLLNVPAGEHQVAAQLIGHSGGAQSVTVVAGQTATVDFTLAATAVALDQIVVTGTAAEVRRKAIGNSLEAVTADQIENAPVANPLQVLQGRTPGVTVMTSSGQPGAGSTIKIRGTTSLSQDTEPLIYVDGVRIFNLPTGVGTDARAAVSPLQDIAAEDIARIEVVKGASATTLYGTEASAGVIQIFTKKGIAGEPIWNAELTTGVSVQGDITPFDDPNQLFTQCGGLMQGIITSDDENTPELDVGETTEWVDPTCPADGDWWEPGPQQTYAVSVRGGAENVTYYLSGNFGSADGTLPTQNSKDGGVRGNFSFAPVQDLTVSLNTAYTRRQTRWAGDGNNADGFLLNVGRGYRGYLRGGKGDDCAGVPEGAACMSNAYLFDVDVNTRSDHFMTGFNAQWNPTEAFSNRITVGWDFFDVNTETTHPFGFIQTPEGFFIDDNTRHTKLSLEYAGSYRNDFSDDLVSTFSVGGQLFRDRHRYTSIQVSEFAAPGEPTIETGAVLDARGELRFAETSAGFFAQEQLAWRDRLFVTGALRVDGNSAFGEDFGLQMYPKLSMSYVLSDYGFWPTAWWDAFKLRAAAGMSGNAPGAFDRFRTWSPVSANEGEPGFSPQDVGNPDIGPEETLEIEAGFDASFFAGRLGLEATAYRAATKDALVDVTLPPSLGFLNPRATNIGEIVNRGLEFQITGGLIRTENVDWQVRTNISLMDSEVTDIGDEFEITADNKAAFREGIPAPSYFGLRITNPDAVANPIIATDTVAIGETTTITNSTAYGPVFPTQLFSLGTTLTLWNRLTVNALAEYQGGHFLPNYTGYQNARRGVWYPCYGIQRLMAEAQRTQSTAPLDEAGITAEQRAKCSMGAVERADGSALIPDFNSDFWIEPADFLKLRSVSLTYAIPSGWIDFARNASVTLSGRNLFTSTDYTGPDPEMEDFADRSDTTLTGGGFFGRRDYYQIPPPRTFLLSFRVGF